MLLSIRSGKRTFVMFLGVMIAAAGWLGGIAATPAEAGPATHLNIISVVPSVRAGDVFLVQVEASDSSNFRDTSFNGPVTISAAAVGGSNFSSGNTVNAVAGLATFTVFLNNSADNYTITATSSGLVSDLSNIFDVTARSLVITNVLANVTSGSTFTVNVEARDGNNNIAENFNGQVTLSADAPGTGDSTFGVTPTANAVAGTATFSNVVLRNAADGYVVTASSTAGVTDPNSGASNSFNVTASHLAALTIGEVRSGDGFTVTVEARDIDNNVAENFTGAVTVSAAAAGGSNFANAGNTQNAAAGIATFAGRVLNNAADGYTVTATSPGPAGDTSNAFDVTARSLAITTVLGDVLAGAPFGLTVEARDGNNNLAENFNGQVTLSADAPGSGDSDFSVTPAANAVAGSATFSGLVLNSPADGYVVTASSTAGVTDPNNSVSNSFDVIGAANEPPVAVDDALSVPRPTGDGAASGTIDVLANDTDPNDDALEVSAFDATGANGGSIACTTGGSCTYTEPDDPCVTSDSFEYTVTDGEFTDVGRVDVTIDCDEPGVETRTVTLTLSRHLIAEGVLAGGPARCTARNPVFVERLVDGAWVVLGTIKTKDDGSFKVRLPDRQGTYRARAPRKEFRLPPVVCGRAVSARAQHTH